MNIDMLRGFAAIVVVLGHTIQLFEGYNDCLLYNIIFSVQMPLFMIISGYTVIFSKNITGTESFLKSVKKKQFLFCYPGLYGHCCGILLHQICLSCPILK